MIIQMLEKLGFFAGQQKELNHEAVFFLGLNNWLLRQSGGAWDNPEPIKELLANPTARERVVQYLKSILASPKAIQYTGVRYYIRYGGIRGFAKPWGWKDPRMTFTLPLWLELFPESKVVHIRRHGVDVAQSLKVRFEKKLAKSPNARVLFGRLYWLRKSRAYLREDLAFSVASLKSGFRLWERYFDHAHAHVVSLADRGYELRYENFLADPEKSLDSLARFCGLDVTPSQIADAISEVNPARAYCFRNDPVLTSFARQVAYRLKARGYSID